jgi:hypothetical protein
MPSWSTGWATGDIVTAAEFRKGVGSIYDATLGVAAAQIDITGLIATYAHLLVALYPRNDIASAAVVVYARFNADAGANYDSQLLRGQAATASAVETFAAAQAQIGTMPGAAAPANVFGALQLFIPNYANSANNKSYSAVSNAKTGTTTGTFFLDCFAGGWRSNAAINRLTFFSSGGNFVAGTRITVYAMGA